MERPRTENELLLALKFSEFLKNFIFRSGSFSGLGLSTFREE
jgi:hypothetical protein